MTKQKNNKKNKNWSKGIKKVTPYAALILIVISIVLGLFDISNLQCNKKDTSTIINGKILNSTLEPIQYVIITINAVHFKAESRADGTFLGEVKGRSKGDKILLTVSHADYQTRKFERIISSKKESFGEIILQK